MGNESFYTLVFLKKLRNNQKEVVAFLKSICGEFHDCMENESLRGVKTNLKIKITTELLRNRKIHHTLETMIKSLESFDNVSVEFKDGDNNIKTSLFCIESCCKDEINIVINQTVAMKLAFMDIETLAKKKSNVSADFNEDTNVIQLSIKLTNDEIKDHDFSNLTLQELSNSMSPFSEKIDALIKERMSNLRNKEFISVSEDNGDFIIKIKF